MLLTLLVLADVIVRWVLDPYHPVRRALDSVMEPVLVPIRRLLPRGGPVDWSPLILLLIIQLVEYVLLRLL
jgi:YggT family protein